MNQFFVAVIAAVISIISQSLHAQNDFYPDSLFVIAQDTSLPYTVRIPAAEKRGDYYLDRDMQEAYSAAKFTLKLAEEHGDPLLRAEAWQSLGNASRSVGRPEVAKKAYSESVSISKMLNNADAQSRSLAALGVVFVRLGILDSAEIVLEEARQLAVQGRDSFMMAQVLSRISLLRTEQGRTNASLDSLVKAFEVAPEHLGLKIMLSTNMCAICNDAKLYQQGLEYCERGLLLAEQSKSGDAKIRILNNYGEIYRGLNNVAKSLEVFEQALTLGPEPFSRIYTLNGLGIGKHLAGKSSEGIEYLKEALLIGKELNAQVEQAVSLDHLSRIHLDTKEYRRAIEYAEQAILLLDDFGGDPVQKTELLANYLSAKTHLGLPIPVDRLENYFILKDSIFNNQKLADLAEVTEKFRLAESRAENAELSLQKSKIDEALRISRQRNYGALMFILLATAGIILLNILRRRNARLAKDVSRLNTELHHRTSNNLNSIIFLLKDHKKRALEEKLDISIANALERQIKAYTKLQEHLNINRVTVNLKNYLEDFCEHLREIFTNAGQPVHFSHNLADVEVKSDFAAPLALIINELATNSLKYAKREDGILSISLDVILEEEEELRIFYHDGGPVDGQIDPTTYSSGQGNSLIEGFTEQLEGEIVRYGKEESYDFEAVFELVA